MKILHQGIRYLLLVSVLQVSLLIMLAYALIRTEEVIRKLDYAGQIHCILLNISSRLYTSVSALGMFALYRDKRYVDKFLDVQSDSQGSPEFRSVKGSPYVRASDIKTIRECSLSADMVMDELRRSLEFYRGKRTSFGVIYFTKKFTHLIGPHLRDLRTEVRGLAKRHARDLESQAELHMKLVTKVIFFIGLFTNILTSTLLLRAFSKSITNPLETMHRNISRMSAGKELLPPIKGSNELAVIDHAFHSMARSVREFGAKDKAIFQNMPLGLLTCTSNNLIEDANPKACELLDYDKAELVGMTIDQLCVDANTEELLMDQQKLERIWFRKKSGTNVPLDLTVSVVVDNNERRYLVSLLDARHRLAIERIKHDFMIVVSQELTIPLSEIVGCLEKLGDSTYGELSARGQHMTRTACQSAARVRRLTTDLVDIANLESAVISISPGNHVVVEVLERAIADVASIAIKKQVTLKTDWSMDSWTTASFDDQRVIQVIVNLLSNAIKFSQTNGSVTVSARVCKNNIEIGVHDEGRGIPQEQLSQVFERFKQVRADDSRSGSGLGLAISKMLVEAHHGTIDVTSQVGRGTSFFVRLPVRQ
jgi:PAS domain S-box-containing protein